MVKCGGGSQSKLRLNHTLLPFLFCFLNLIFIDFTPCVSIPYTDLLPTWTSEEAETRGRGSTRADIQKSPVANYINHHRVCPPRQPFKLVFTSIHLSQQYLRDSSVLVTVGLEKV